MLDQQTRQTVQRVVVELEGRWRKHDAAGDFRDGDRGHHRGYEQHDLASAARRHSTDHSVSSNATGVQLLRR
jgi:hypothetical protein